jgi:hypothetical protein
MNTAFVKISCQHGAFNSERISTTAIARVDVHQSSDEITLVSILALIRAGVPAIMLTRLSF